MALAALLVAIVSAVFAGLAAWFSQRAAVASEEVAARGRMSGGPRRSR